MSARSVMGFLSDVYATAADEVGKIQLIADEMMQGTVFDLSEEIAKELLKKELPPGNTLLKISKRTWFSWRHVSGGGSRTSRGWGRSQDSDFVDGGSDSFRRGGRSPRPSTNRWSSGSSSRSNSDDWLIGGGRSCRSSPMGSRRDG